MDLLKSEMLFRFSNNCLFDATIKSLEYQGIGINYVKCANKSHHLHFQLIKYCSRCHLAKQDDVAKRCQPFESTSRSTGCHLKSSNNDSKELAFQLRKASNAILKHEGLPAAPFGEPAGGEYLRALSKLLNIQFNVKSSSSDSNFFQVKHELVSNSAPIVKISHLKYFGKDPGVDGHWIAIK